MPTISLRALIASGSPSVMPLGSGSSRMPSTAVHRTGRPSQRPTITPAALMPLASLVPAQPCGHVVRSTIPELDVHTKACCWHPPVSAQPTMSPASFTAQARLRAPPNVPRSSGAASYRVQNSACPPPLPGMSLSPTMLPALLMSYANTLTAPGGSWSSTALPVLGRKYALKGEPRVNVIPATSPASLIPCPVARPETMRSVDPSAADQNTAETPTSVWLNPA